MQHREMKQSPSTTRSRSARAFTAAVGVAAISVMAACSTETVTDPDGAARAGLLGGTVGVLTNTLSAVTGLLRLTPLSQPVTRSVLVTRRAGGELRVPETGLRLTIPAGAIAKDTMTITVTALPGRLVAYEFEPHGTQFAKPLTFSQDLSATSWVLSLLKPSLGGGYFKNASQLNTQTGVSQVNEELVARLEAGRVSFDISHFSGYMVSTGRQSRPAASPSSDEQ
jgi:hypothetical protein